METQLKLTLEGKVSTNSGKLLIIDPCYLDNFDFSPIEQFENEYEKKHIRLMTMEMKIKYAPLLKMANREAIKKYGKRLDINIEEYKKEREKFIKEPSLNPPCIAQTDDYVYFHNTIGDGFYPIVQTKERIQIIFNYPLTANGKTDKSRLNGKLLGHSAVDSGTQVIIDPSIAPIKKNHKDLYCILNVPKGAYKCKFIQENDILSIRHCTQED